MSAPMIETDESLMTEEDVARFRPWFDAQAGNQTIDHGFAPFGGTTLAWVLPPFQRPLVWSREQQTKLIESLWAGLPIGSYAYNEGLDTPCEFWLIDGQQRWEAIRAYVSGEFPVHGYLFTDLLPMLQRKFRRRPFPAYRMDTDDESELRDIYDRLAYGGTPHAAPFPTEDRT